MHLDYRAATAEATGLASGGYDAFTAGQCWHWFDRPSAAAEARRLLRAGGAIVICHFDWLPLPGSVVEATEELILQTIGARLVQRALGCTLSWALDVAGAGFGGIETFSYDLNVSYSREAWRGRDPGRRSASPPRCRKRRSSASTAITPPCWPPASRATPYSYPTGSGLWSRAALRYTDPGPSRPGLALVAHPRGGTSFWAHPAPRPENAKPSLCSDSS